MDRPKPDSVPPSYAIASASSSRMGGKPPRNPFRKHIPVLPGDKDRLRIIPTPNAFDEIALSAQRDRRQDRVIRFEYLLDPPYEFTRAALHLPDLVDEEHPARLRLHRRESDLLECLYVNAVRAYPRSGARILACQFAPLPFEGCHLEADPLPIVVADLIRVKPGGGAAEEIGDLPHDGRLPAPRGTGQKDPLTGGTHPARQSARPPPRGLRG